MNKIYILAITSLLNLNFLKAQTTFGWETATNNGNTITETIDGITVTFTGTNDAETDLRINPTEGYCSSSDYTVWESNNTLYVTLSFSEPVDIISILAMNGQGRRNTYTFTPTGGTNSPVVTSIVNGCAPTVNLNWTSVTSFTVSAPTNNNFGFDNLVVNSSTLSVVDFPSKTMNIFPNPSSDFIQLTRLIKKENYIIYNILGSEVKSGSISNDDKIDIQDLKNGTYFVKINNSNTIRFVKREANK